MFSHNVKTLFDKHLLNKFMSTPDIARALMSHERKKLVIDNLCEQIIRMEQGNIKVNASKYKLAIESVADMFAHTALTHWEKSARSAAAKRAEIDEADRIKNAEEHIREETKEALSTTIKSFPSVSKGS